MNVRLNDGQDRYEGRVDIYDGHNWGSLCDNTISLNEAKVICSTATGYRYLFITFLFCQKFIKHTSIKICISNARFTFIEHISDIRIKTVKRQKQTRHCGALKHEN